MKRGINYYFLGLALFLTAFGLLFLSTLSAITSLQLFGNTTYYVYHQLFAIVIGLVAGIIAFKFPLPLLKKISPVLTIVNLVALLIVFLPVVGTKLFGASRWINIGGATFQPSEFFKISAILYVSALLANKLSSGNVKKGFSPSLKKGYESFITLYVPFAIFLGIIVIMFILQRDISTLGITLVSLLTIYFIARTPLWHTITSAVIGGIALLGLIKFEPYRFERLLVFLHPNADPLGIGHQLKQSVIAIGSGGWFGKGLGMSTQKFGFLPQAMSDSVFAILGEETGIVGCVILILVFLLFLWLGFQIANKATDRFSQFTAVGLTTWIVFQAFINIASSMGLFPLAGIPLPFFSYGGSHLMAELIAVGLLLNISKNG